MGKQHHGHGHHSWHSHHSHHHHHHHHHHGGHDYMFGTRAEDVLNGGHANDVIYGLIGNDELFGNEGNDWLIGGRGNDLLDGGPGRDKVFGGRGDDDLVYTAAENAANGACGRGDFYDGGKDHDTLHLVLTADEMADPGVQADIAAFKDFLANNPGGCGYHNQVFKFESLHLAVRSIEELVVDGEDVPPAGNNEAPQGNADTVQTLEDNAIVIDVLANDTDADGDPLTAIIVKDPAHGTLVPNADGTFTYTPEADYNNNFPDGADGFSYRASDGTAESEITDVVINITPVNDAPRMVKDPDWGPVDVNNGIPANVKVDILSYYSPGPADESDQNLDFDFGLSGDVFPTLYGMAGRTLDNTISYTAFSEPPMDGVLHDSFAYNVTDGVGGVTPAIFEIDII